MRTNKYITPETGTILNGLFEGAEGFEVITPEYLKETDAFGSDRYIIRAENKRFNTYLENDLGYYFVSSEKYH